MKRTIARLVFVGIVLLGVAPASPAAAQAQQPPKLEMPKPGVPEIMTMEGKFVRAAYNNEGYVILGYQVANRSVGEEWMLLEVGMTVRDRTPDYTLKRDATLARDTRRQDASPAVDRRSTGRATPRRCRTGRRSSATRSTTSRRARTGPARSTFFPDLTSRALPRDEVELSTPRACLGRLYFQRAGRHHVRPALAQREVREEPRARAVPDPDRRRGEAPVEELQGHREAGQGSVRPEEEVTANGRVARLTPGFGPALRTRLPATAVGA